jgi:hypothetical protein
MGSKECGEIPPLEVPSPASIFIKILHSIKIKHRNVAKFFEI